MVTTPQITLLVKSVEIILTRNNEILRLAFKILETGRLEKMSVLEKVPSIVWLTPVSCEDEN